MPAPEPKKAQEEQRLILSKFGTQYSVGYDAANDTGVLVVAALRFITYSEVLAQNKVNFPNMIVIRPIRLS